LLRLEGWWVDHIVFEGVFMFGFQPCYNLLKNYNVFVYYGRPKHKEMKG
jgi:hypothetical protein